MNPVDDEEMTPAEIQAQANSAKINKFMGKIGWQILILTIVVYATFMGNEAAEWMLGAYACLVAISGAAFFFVTTRSLERLVVNTPPGLDEIMLDTPTSKVIRVIGTMFSIVEISLLVSYGFFFIAALWAFAEVFQYTASAKLRRARSFFDDVDEFEDDADEQIEFDEVLRRIDGLIEVIENDDWLNNEAQEKAVLALLAERQKVVDLHERYVAITQDDEK